MIISASDVVLLRLPHQRLEIGVGKVASVERRTNRKQVNVGQSNAEA